MTHPFLKIAATTDRLRYTLPVTPHVCAGPPGRQFLFGGAGLAASVAAMEAASDRPAIWATAHYISYAQPGSDADVHVALSAIGKAITQARATIMLGEREVLLATAALGTRDSLTDQWAQMDSVPHWRDCEETQHWSGDGTLGSRFRFRPAYGVFSNIPEDRIRRDDGRLQLWMRPRDDVSIDRVLLAVIADFLSPGIRNATGRHAGGNSLDNTIRYCSMVETEWVLCDIMIDAIASGFVHGTMHIFAENGHLLAIASQSMILRVRD